MIQSAVGALVVREGALSGSFPNPGTIGRRKDKAQTTGAFPTAFKLVQGRLHRRTARKNKGRDRHCC